MESTAIGREGRHSAASVKRPAATVATAATRPASSQAIRAVTPPPAEKPAAPTRAVDPAGRVAGRRGRRRLRQRAGEGLGRRGRRVVPVLEAARATRPPAELVGEGRRLAAPFAPAAERHRPGATVERPGDAGLTAAAGSWQAEPDAVVAADLAKPRWRPRSRRPGSPRARRARPRSSRAR